jgi:hypothetical protein
VEFIDGAEIYIGGYFWKGKNPDNLADMIHKWRSWSVVFEGALPD